MSLINDALKKAQRDRDEAGRTPPPSPGRGPVPPSEGPRRFPFVMVAVVAAVAAGTTVLLLRWMTPAEAPRETSPVVAAAPIPAPAPVAAGPSPVPTAQPTAAPTSTPLPLLTLSPEAEQARIQAIVDRLTITAVRITESGNRALVNDRLLRVGDPLEGMPGVKVREISAERIEFIDTSGRTYTKRR